MSRVGARLVSGDAFRHAVVADANEDGFQPLRPADDAQRLKPVFMGPWCGIAKSMP